MRVVIRNSILRAYARLLVLAVFAASGVNMQAQVENDVLQRMENTFLVFDSLILGSHHKSSAVTNSQIPQSYFDRQEQSLSRVDSSLAAVTKARMGAMMSKTGLELSVSAYYRLDNKLNLDEDETVQPYDGKAQAMLKWNILGSSLINRQGRIKELLIAENIERLRYRQEDLGLLVVKQKELFRKSYDEALAAVLVHHIHSLSLLSEAQEYLLRSENISSDRLMTILNEKAEAERLFASTAMDDDCLGATDLSCPTGVVMVVDTVALYNKVRATQYDMNILDLRMQLLDRQRKNTKYWTTMTVAPFARYDHYFKPGYEHGRNLDLGVSMNFPLSAETAKKRRALKAEQSLAAAERARVEDKVIEEVRLIVDEVLRLNRSTMGELQRIRKQKEYIAMRVDAYNNRHGGYDMMARAKEYNKYFECWERLLQFQYQRDCLIADIQAFLTDTSVLEFCSEVKL